MRIHRAVTLVVLMAISVAFLVVSTADAVRGWTPRSLAALLVVVAAAAAGGIAFSWKRYFPRKQRDTPFRKS